MRRLDMIASMAKTGDEMSLTDKEAIIQVIETKRSQTRTYFDNLGYHVITFDVFRVQFLISFLLTWIENKVLDHTRPVY